MSDYDAILFDFDGVLSDTEPLHFRCWKEVLADFGVYPTWDWFAKNCIGTSEHDTLQGLRLLASPPLDFDALWAQYPRKKELFRKVIADGVPLGPGAQELLQELQGRYGIAVVSSSSRREVQAALEAPAFGGISARQFVGVRSRTSNLLRTPYSPGCGVARREASPGGRRLRRRRCQRPGGWFRFRARGVGGRDGRGSQGAIEGQWNTWLSASPAFASRGRDSGRPLPPAQIRTGGFPAYGSYLGWMASKPIICSGALPSAPGTHVARPVSVACVAVGRSPWSQAFPPGSPRSVALPCSNPSSVLRPSPTPGRRACGSRGYRLSPPVCRPTAPQMPTRSPGSRA